MSFRKRKKKSNNTHFKLSHTNTNTNGDMDTITNMSSSISLSFQHNHNSARIQSTDTHNKKKRKRRKMRIKASQRSFQSNNNINTDNSSPQPLINLHSNIGVYNDEYLNSLKLENKSMAIPEHIKKTINDNKNNLTTSNIDTNDTEIEMKDDNNNKDNSDFSMDDDDSIQAKILTSKLQRRTKALSNAIETHAQNTNTHSNREIYNKQNKYSDPMQRFMELGKFKSTKDEIEERLNEHNKTEIDIDLTINHDNDDFEMQQMAKSGVKLKTKRKRKRNVIVIDDNENENDNTFEFSKSSEWNICHENDDNILTLEDVYKMIDNDINGKQNIMRPPMGNYNISYENVEQEYYDIDNKLTLNIKQCEMIEEKYEFFKKLQNESVAYLNCLSEKQTMIDKYMKMNIYLRENRYDVLRMNYCLNELEAFHEAFYPNDFIKDINSANAYQKLTDLNGMINNNNNERIEEEKNGKNNESIFDFNCQDLNIWNEERQILNKKNYLLSKKKRNEYRQQYERRKLQSDLGNIDYYSNDNIENNYFISREKLLKEMKSIFDDTRVQYRSFNVLNDVLNKWKKKYKQEYEKAFVSISIPKLIAPFVRLELIEWNALKCKVNIDDNSDEELDILCKPKLFITHKWYELIANYGINENGEMEENDNDDSIVPTLVGTLVINELINIIKYDWNIYNKIETKQLLLNINCAFEHIDGYKQFESKREELIKCLYDKCDEMVNDLIDLKCINGMIVKILPNFKRLPNKPLDCIDSNSNQIHDINCNLPNGLMYKNIKKRVFNALKLLECLSIIIVGVNGSIEYMNKTIEHVYKSVIEGFVTYLARCPIRKAKNDNCAQIVILSDLNNIVKSLFDIKDEWMLLRQVEDEEGEGDDNDIQMNVKDQDFKLPEYIMKHIKRSVLEIHDNINNTIKSNVNVTQHLNFLNHICEV